MVVILKKGFTLAEVFIPHSGSQRKIAFTLAEVFIPHSDSQRKIAFTLAEVLITLGIIGVVAAMTLPTVINKINNKQNITAMKKAYSELSQITQTLNYEYGGNFTMACNDFDDDCLRNLFAEKMKVIKKCKSSAPNECQGKSYFADGTEQKNYLNLNDSWPMIVTESGYSVKFRFHIANCDSYSNNLKDSDGTLIELKTCGWMQVDTNGKMKPNTLGKDIFVIDIFKNKLIPVDLNKDLQTNGLDALFEELL